MLLKKMAKIRTPFEPTIYSW